jgi:demethylmenaquinone methyltransferase/2-methoxy-6-polyprenyl-1,4-benzoquinol methylase
MTRVDFGYKKVAPDEKTRLVRGVFESVAENYDLMNDLMSLGTHRLFKRMTLQMSGVREGHRVLDLAGGTGDLAALFAPVVGATGTVLLADINAEMMRVGRDRLTDRGFAQVSFCQANGERLPFPDASFNCITIGFGLRNFTDKLKALTELNRILVPGGVLLVLEFSKPENPIVDAGYRAFQSLWPGIGKLLVGDADSYRYLVESIDMHPSQEALKLMMEDAGFADVSYHNLLSGVAAIHRGEKPAADGSR